jgi:type II secretory pathway pseudopilin PulG
MSSTNRRGLTLVESVVSIFILTIVLIGLLSTFYVAKSTSSHAKHRMAAINILQVYIEQEVLAGYDGGGGTTGNYFVTVTSASPVAVVMDENLNGAITPDPYFPDNIKSADGTLLTYKGIPYKIVGFVVSWTEKNGQACSERACCYVSYH